MRAPRALLLALGLLVVGLGTALGGGFGLSTEVGDLRAGSMREAAAELRSAHRTGVRRALSAPRVLGVRRAKLERIAACESHGNPRAVSSDGTYRGKYQFDRGTWKSQGGRGDPAKAPELEQDQRAAILYRSAGNNPWPNC